MNTARFTGGGEWTLLPPYKRNSFKYYLKNNRIKQIVITIRGKTIRYSEHSLQIREGLTFYKGKSQPSEHSSQNVSYHQ
jgi:hypothetical protein